MGVSIPGEPGEVKKKTHFTYEDLNVRPQAGAKGFWGNPLVKKIIEQKGTGMIDAATNALNAYAYDISQKKELQEKNPTADGEGGPTGDNPLVVGKGRRTQ